MPKYNDSILNYYNDDSHVGTFDANVSNVGTGYVGSPSCGDVMKLQVQITNDRIVDAKILVFGCGSAKASSSYVAEQLIGKTIDEALKIKNTDIAEYLGLPRIKLHCSVLAEEAIKRAIEDFRRKNVTNSSSNGAFQMKKNIDVNKKQSNASSSIPTNMSENDATNNGNSNRNANIATIDTININRTTRHSGCVADNINVQDKSEFIDNNSVFDTKTVISNDKFHDEYRNLNPVDVDTICNARINGETLQFDLKISDAAVTFVKTHLDKICKHAKGIRLNLEEGHCGFMYKVRFVAADADVSDDVEFISNGLHIFVPKNEVYILNGTEIDFKDDGLKRGLVFRNPRETKRCSCGTSFSIDPTEQNT